MVVSVELNEEEISRLKSLTQSDSDSGAVTAAAREYLRLIELRQLKAASGQVDFCIDWQELEQRELLELDASTK